MLVKQDTAEYRSNQIAKIRAEDQPHAHYSVKFYGENGSTHNLNIHSKELHYIWQLLTGQYGEVKRAMEHEIFSNSLNEIEV